MNKIINTKGWMFNYQYWLDELNDEPLLQLQLLSLVSFVNDFGDEENKQFSGLLISGGKLNDTSKALLGMFASCEDVHTRISRINDIVDNRLKNYLFSNFTPDFYRICTMLEFPENMRKVRAFTDWLSGPVANMSVTNIAYRKILQDLVLTQVRPLGGELRKSTQSLSDALREPLVSICIVCNESRRITRHIEMLEPYVNHFFYYLDRCNDETEEIIRGLVPNDKLTLFVNRDSFFHDGQAYTTIFRELRARGFKNLIKIDPDEEINVQRLLAELSRSPRKFYKSLSVSVPWIQKGPLGYFLEADHQKSLIYSRNPIHYKEVLLIDDGISHHLNIPFHCPWTPFQAEREDLVIGLPDDLSIGLFHNDKDEFAGLASYILKSDAYTMNDFYSAGFKLLFKRCSPRHAFVLRGLGTNGEELISRSLTDYLKSFASVEHEKFIGDIFEGIKKDPDTQNYLFLDWGKVGLSRNIADLLLPFQHKNRSSPSLPSG